MLRFTVRQATLPCTSERSAPPAYALEFTAQHGAHANESSTAGHGGTKRGLFKSDTRKYQQGTINIQ